MSNLDVLYMQVKGITALINASLGHGDSAEVQAGVAGALRNLSVSASIAQTIVDNGAIGSSNPNLDLTFTLYFNPICQPYLSPLP